ncbi:hypothetical protein BOTBODRAFT_107003 [Botryobasidium botryosum FD-172 SS1]|uniref:TNase-like domain-containing protein n=1 Tax=Botryobasidium botryosum (strain FD-172 SS1) TaxID=930990 RepID=A0A067MLC6_BOTB1|nr:hypothetical protein BOTBODRAFT_107003 [Botryobasidium botryosum FD-172 SS1]
MAGAVGLTLLGGRVYARHLKRLSNAETMDPAFITKQRKIRGIVTSVGDSDDFHIYHIARPYWLRSSLARLPSKTRKDLKGETIHIRLAGMDAPELPHFGMPGQPHGPAAKDWLTSKILGKTVRCTIHKRDQYQRIVASVYYRPSIYWPLLTNLSLEMVRSGWGCVYTQAGAEYGKEGIDRYLKAQQEAQKKRRGMWADGLDVETPAEYKERMKKGKAAPRPK